MNEPKLYKKKPVVIEAVQLTAKAVLDSLADKTPIFEGLQASGSWDSTTRKLNYGHVLIKTLEGTMKAEIGDWIIKGVKGELYPCKPDIFMATYDPV